MKSKRKMSNFKGSVFQRRLRNVILSVVVIGVALMTLLCVYLNVYEQNHSTYLVDTIVEAYKQNDIEHISKYIKKDQIDRLKKALPNIIDKKNIFSFQSFEDKKKIEYTIVNKNQKLSTVVLEKQKEKAMFGIQQYKVKDIEHYATYRTQLQFFAGTQVQVDGNQVSVDDTQGQVTTQFASIGQDELTIHTYTYEGYEPLNHISATYQGQPCDKTINEKTNTVMLFPSVPTGQDVAIQSILEQFSMEYARYTTVRSVPANNVKQYVLTNSTLANMIDSYSNAWGEVITAESFHDFSAVNAIQYYENVYSFDVHLRYRVRADNGEEKDFPLNYRMFVKGDGAQNYKVFDLKRISQQELKRVAASDGIAAKIDADLKVNTQALSNACVDGNAMSGYTFLSEEQLYISSKQPIGAIYIKWNEIPQSYQVAYGSRQKDFGEKGFLHELIRIDKKANEVTLKGIEGFTINEISVYTKGNLPPEVQDWQTPHKKADILAFPTHADDDVLFFGALLSEYAAKGKDIQVAFLTNSNNTNTTVNSSVRQHEALDGLWAMGIDAYPIVGSFADHSSRDLSHAKSLYDNDAILKYQVETIRRFKPEIVIGHDEQGEYGHGVHMLNTHLLKEAINVANDKNFDEQSNDKYGIHQVKKTYFHLYKQNQIVLDVHKKMSELAGKSPFEVATSAYQKHESQHIYELAVEDFGVSDCRLFGLYKSNVGYDFKTNDLFEGI